MHKTTVGRDDAKQFPPGTFVTDDVMRALPDTDVFGVKWKPNQPKKELGNAKFRNCAIVSSSSTLKKKRLGKQIDENDVILRLNNAPTKGHEVDVGSRTTVRFTNEAYQGMREHAMEALVGKWQIQNPRADRLPKMMAKKIRAKKAKEIGARSRPVTKHRGRKVLMKAHKIRAKKAKSCDEVDVRRELVICGV